MTEKETAVTMAYKNLFGSEHGQTVLDDLDRVGKFRMPDMCFNPDSERLTCFELGKLSVVRYIHGRIDKNLMAQEKSKAIHKEI